MYDLFENQRPDTATKTHLAEGACILHGYALPQVANLLVELKRLTSLAPLRHLITPGGFKMSVAMSNCGKVGWVSDRSGYRYDTLDPESGDPWPDMPTIFTHLAQNAAESAGFSNYSPDACLINNYQPGSRLSLHQDRDENDAHAPIVSVSLGLPATFLFGGFKRRDRPKRYRLDHGDVVVWGGPARFIFHGVLPIAEGHHSLLGNRRVNITFRKVY